MPELRAGWAKRDITPDPGYGLSGYIARRKVSTGVLDSLYVRVLLFEQETTRATIVLADVLLLSSRWADHLRQRISAKLNIPPEFVIVVATHTHSGPILDMYPFDFSGGVRESDLDRYAKTLEDIIVAAVNDAEGRLESVEASFANTQIHNIATDRNRPRCSRRQSLSIFRFAAKQETALLAVFGCHPTVLGADNLLFSGDLHGEVSRTLEESNAIALVANGAAANISTRFTRKARSAAELKRLATIIATEASGAQFRPLPFSTILARSQNIGLRLANPADTPPSLPSGKTGGAMALVDEALRVREQLTHAAEFNAPTLNISITTWRIGPITLAFLPLEIYSDTGNFLWKRLRMVAVGYAMGYWGYLPSADAGRNDYEVLSSPFATEADQQLRKALIARNDSAKDEGAYL